MLHPAIPHRCSTLSWSGKSKRVLVVEDDEDQKLMLKDFLESYFCRVTAVTNRIEALNAVMETDYDVILCDMVMPNMAGDVFHFEVQRVKPHLCERFIFITDHPVDPRVKEFLNRVGALVLRNPFHLDDLLEMILLLFRELEGPEAELAVPSEPARITPGPPKVSRDGVLAPCERSGQGTLNRSGQVDRV